MLGKGDCRLDQWLWFARLTRSRSLAAKLCAAGVVFVNGAAARKPSQPIRIGDAVVVRRGSRDRAVRVLALGARRGPASEARFLYDETVSTVPLPASAAEWTPLLIDEPPVGIGGDVEG
jgi:ribosome-associated heat shock protein Hsp15